EYVERYAELAGWLCERGYAVCGNDHIGHKNTAILSAQRLGYFGGIGSWPYLIEDVELLRKKLAPRFAGLPWIMLGHSMGSFIARLYAEKYGNNLTALILSGTAGKNPVIPAARAMATAAIAYRGPMFISKTLDKMMSSTLNKGIAHPQTPSDWVTSDQQILAKHANDPYCCFTFTVSAQQDLFTMMLRCNRSDWFKALPKALPVLLFSGDKDSVGDFGKGPRQVSERLKAAGMRDVTLHLYPDGRHEMLNEVNRQDVYQDVYAWIVEHTETA
ncbi:MAG: alpha/beta fold hydrolase, partial [Angelakisella sp.]